MKEWIEFKGLGDDEVKMVRYLLQILRKGDKRLIRLIYFFAKNL